MRPDLLPYAVEPIPVLDHGFVRLVDCMGGDEDIEAAARLSFNQGTRSVDERRKLIRYLMRQKHSSPFEQVVIKLEMKLPIFVARQLVRHRTQALNEVSARYSVLPDEVYIPAPERVQAQSTANKQGSGAALDEEIVAEFVDGLKIDSRMAFGSYDFAVTNGIARETARIGLPVNTYTRWVTTMSAHNLLHLLQLRLDEHAQWETRQYAEAIAKIVADWIPLTWEAFVEYRLRAVTLSGTEVDIVRQVLDMRHGAGALILHDAAERLSERELGELRVKLGLVLRPGESPD
ncbi:MAG: hypothetical protein RIS45_20 [Planctomycetota bacterium]|jgi:thymidylate synthase (FAD)